MTRARGAVAIGGGALLLLIFVHRFVVIELFVRRAGVPILLAAVVTLAAAGVGRVVRRDDDLPSNLVIGLPLLGAMSFLAALIRVELSAALLLWSAAVFLPFPKRNPGADPAQPPVLSVAFLTIAGACAFVLAQAPPSSLDELAYHLAVPKAWIAEGRAVELPLISHSYFPLGIESASLPLLTLSGGMEGGIASHFLHLLAAVATCVILFRFVARRASSQAAWLVTTAVATTPALAIIAGWSLVEWPLIGICLLLVDALDRGDDRTLGASLAAGLLTKYTFIPFALLALLAKRRWRVPPLALAGTVFFIRNAILTGNPFAPFFAIGAPHLSGYRGAPSIANYLFEGSFIDEAIGVGIVVFLFLARGATAWLLLGAGAGLFLLAPSSRVLLPFLVIPAAMTSFDDLTPRLRRAVTWLVMLAVSAQLALVVLFVDRTGTFDLLSGRQTDEHHLAQQRPSFASVAWLNSVLPPGARTLVVGLNETYWFSGRVRGAGNFDGDRVSRYLDAPTPEALRERLERDGITHVAVVAQRPATTVRRKLEERQTLLAPAARRNLAQLLDRFAASVASQGDATLFALR